MTPWNCAKCEDTGVVEDHCGSGHDWFHDCDCPIGLARNPRTRRRQRPEARVQKAIIRYLLDRGVILAVTDAGSTYGISKGWPDLTCCVPPYGQFLGIECKSAKGKQTPAQLTAMHKIGAAGGRYILAHSLREFIIQYEPVETPGNLVGTSED
jgi:hypothetical protein